MYRATTPIHYFKLPVESDTVERFLLTYTQNGEIILEKTEADMTVKDNVWSVMLTQEETKLFKADEAAVQIRILTTGGVAQASKEYRLNVLAVQNDEVLA